MARADHRRLVPNAAPVMLKNRFFEENPVLTTDGQSVISRPAAKRHVQIGDGPIRGIYSGPGTFSEAAFAVSDDDLYSVGQDGAAALVGALGTNSNRAVVMAAAGNIGDTVPERLFIADGALWVYTTNGYASGTLDFTGALTNGEQVRIDSVYYQFTTGSVDSGTPDGGSGNPWLVAIEAQLADSIQNLVDCIMGSGTAGTQYSTAATAHTTVAVGAFTGTEMAVNALTAGAAGNAIVTTETGTNMAWGAGTLSGGGSASLLNVRVPGDVGAISVAHINDYIIVVPAQNQDVNGRFYWIEPGETTIDALNFATAERSPDAILQCLVFSDMVWFLGQNTTEAWVTTGDLDTPFRRFEGVLFDRGIWEGTAVQVKDSLVLVDQNGAVFQLSGGLNRISPYNIEERIRKAIIRQGVA